MSRRFNRLPIALLLIALCLPGAAAVAQTQAVPVRGAIADLSAGATSIDWSPLVENRGFVLTVSAPDGSVFRQEFEAGKAPTFGVFDRQGNHRPDGVYKWELTAVPTLDKGTREELRTAREAGTASALLTKLQASGKLPKEPLVQSGTFAIQGGALVTPGQFREDEGLQNQSAQQLNNITAEDVVYADDVIIQRSLCVGFDCVNGEAFGFDTIRLKENNTRIKFEDTSASAGFPTTDWQLTANDSASGGLNKFSIEDITSARVPFTVEGGATTNSLYVDSTGRVGFRTSTPVLDLHVSTSNTPGIRLEQTNAGGFTAQTWDIAGNEANFFVRDVTGGSRLPLRIRPGAPTSSIDVSASGNVGFGTASPEFNLDARSNAAAFLGLTTFADAGDPQYVLRKARGTSAAPTAVQAGNNLGSFSFRGYTGADFTGSRVQIIGTATENWSTTANGTRLTFWTTPNTTTGIQQRLIIDQNGNVGIGTATPGGTLDVNGPIFQRGGQIHADYVFDPDYNLLSIEENAEFMWKNRHLPALQARTVDDEGREVIELGSSRRGMLEELEKAHIYIAQLNENLSAKDEKIAEVEQQNAELAERLARIEALLLENRQ
jgi:hypothetical protein